MAMESIPVMTGGLSLQGGKAGNDAHNSIVIERLAEKGSDQSRSQGRDDEYITISWGSACSAKSPHYGSHDG